MRESKSLALPLGDTPINSLNILSQKERDVNIFIQSFEKLRYQTIKKDKYYQQFIGWEMLVKIRLLKRYGIFFVIGGVGYAALELLWRGRTHWSMMLAGGLCFVLFSLIAERLVSRSIVFKAALCSVAVTAVELIFGIIFNIILKMRVWDYSHLPLNLYGQICPRYTLLWAGLALLLLPLVDLINKKIKV